MSPRFIIVGGKLAKDPAQTGLTDHDQVVETLADDATPKREGIFGRDSVVSQRAGSRYVAGRCDDWRWTGSVVLTCRRAPKGKWVHHLDDLFCAPVRAEKPRPFVLMGESRTV
jgi:hypothetical protein